MGIQDLDFGEVGAEGRAGRAGPTAHWGHQPGPPWPRLELEGTGPWQGPAFPSCRSLDLGGGGLQLGSRWVKAGLDATRGPGVLDREGGR